MQPCSSRSHVPTPAAAPADAFSITFPNIKDIIMNYDYPINEQLTSLTLAYNNKSFIADLVLPRVPVITESFKYLEYPKEQFLTVPDTTIGPKGEANTVELSAKLVSASVEDRALKEKIPVAKLDAATKSGQDPKFEEKVTIQVTKLLQLDRERKCAALFGNSANYGKTQTLSGTDCFNDPGSDAINIIQDMIDNMLMAPNKLVMGRKVASALRRNRSIVAAYHGNSGEKGMVPLEFLKDLFGFQEILVGESVMNSAKKGQTAQLVGVWGNFLSMIYTDETATTDQGMTFGYTAEYENRTVREWMEEDKGIKGCKVIQVHEQCSELIAAPECGGLLLNVLK